MAVISEDEGGILRETRDSPPSDYLFKIKSFSLFSKNDLQKIESNAFVAGGHKWKIVFFPNGRYGDNGKYISIYLSVENKNSLLAGKEINAVFRFFVFDQIRGKYLSVQGSARRFDRVKYEWGFSKYLSLEAFKEPSNGFLVKDTCFIGAEIFVIQSSSLRECLSISDIADIPKTYIWTITQFSKLGEDVYSDEFVMGDYKWKLNIFPEGRSENRGCSLSVYLVCVGSKSFTSAQKVKAEYTISLKDQINKNHVEAEDYAWFGSSTENWGWGSFIELKDFRDSKNGYLLEDCCTFEAEVRVTCETRQKTLNC